MTEWTYNVKITTEVGAGISDVVQQLSSAQEFAKEQYTNIANFLGDDFSKDLIERLVERLISRKQDETDEEKETPERVREMLQTLKEMREAVGLMEEIGKGDLNEIIESFRRISDIVKPEDITKTLADVVSIEFSKMREEQLVALKNSLSDLGVGVDAELSKDTKQKMLLTTEEEQNLIKRFEASPFGSDVETEMDIYQANLAQRLTQELGGFLRGIDKKSGKKVFEEILPGGIKNPAYKIIADNMTELARATQRFAANSKLIQEGQEMDEEEFDDSMSDYESIKTVFLSDKLWKPLKEQFLEGVMNSLTDSESLLSKEGSTEFLEIIINNIVESIREDIEQTNFLIEGSNPGIARALKNVLTKPDSYLNKFTEFRDQLEALTTGGDVFKLDELFKQLPDLINKAEADAAGEYEPEAQIRASLKKNIGNYDSEGAGYSDIIAETVSDFYVNIMRGGLQKDVIKLHDKAISMGADIGEGFLGDNPLENIDVLTKTIDILHSLGQINDLQSQPISSGYVNTSENLDFQEYFKEATADRENKLQMTLNHISHILNTLMIYAENSDVELTRGIEQSISSIDNLGGAISSLSMLAASATNLNSLD